MNACDTLVYPAANAVPILPVRKDDLAGLRERQPRAAAWAETIGFAADAGTVCVVAGDDARLERVLLGLGESVLWDWAAAAAKLPRQLYRIDHAYPPKEATAAALGWALAGYRFDRYRQPAADGACLVWPEAADEAAVRRTADAVFLARDLINTPASDMGPAELAAAIASVAERFSAHVKTIDGDDLLAQGYPAIHAVGRASSRAPRLIDLVWGEATAPQVTLIGKGVCFDTGGLDIKPSSAMKLMKKDMGGAAIMLGLAQMVMAANLPVRLRLLVPAVENCISGNAIRPLDVIRTRKGVSVEIGNTDAEGRLILADALTEAAATGPDLLIDCATLTGAARVALGTELPALFSNDDTLAEALLEHGSNCDDPLWRLPLWSPYRRHLAGKSTDLTNAPDGSFAGAIFAALFLAEFVEPSCPWAHIDVMAWNTESRPGRPEGGEAMTMRALFALLADRFRR